MVANCGMAVKTLSGAGRHRNIMYALFSTQRIPLTADNPSRPPQLIQKGSEHVCGEDNGKQKFQRCRFGKASL